MAKQQQALAAEGASVADQAAAAEQLRASTCKHTVLFSFTFAGGEPVLFSGFYYTLAERDYVFKVPKPQNERFFELLRGGRDCFFLSPPPTGWLEEKNKSCAAEKARRAALAAGAAAGGGGGGGGEAVGGGGGSAMD